MSLLKDNEKYEIECEERNELYIEFKPNKMVCELNLYLGYLSILNKSGEQIFYIEFNADEEDDEEEDNE